MPVSKPRRRQPTRRSSTSRREGGDAAPRARGKLTPAQVERRRRLGWGLVVFGAVVFTQHLFSHMGFFTVISSGWDDLLVGYPLAGLLVVGGGMLLSKT